MRQTEDVFEARLRKLQTQSQPAADKPARNKELTIRPGALSIKPMAPEPDERPSYLLPIVASAFLIIGGAAFAAMLVLTDAPSFAANDAQIELLHSP